MAKQNGIQEVVANKPAPIAPAFSMMGIPGMTPAIAESVAKQISNAIVRQQMAMMNPRDPLDVDARLTDLCKNPEFARAAVYEKPVGGGQKMRGLSARFAEAALPILKNIDTTATQIYDDAERQTWRVSVADLETNTVFSEEVFVAKRVERKHLKDGQQYIGQPRINSYGDTTYLVEATDDEVDTRRKALCSKVRRNLILQHIPPDLKIKCRDLCVSKADERDAVDPDLARKRIVASFLEVGVGVDGLKAYLGHAVNSVSDSELSELRVVYTAIRDGEALWEDILADRKESRSSGVAKVRKSVAENREREGRARAPRQPATPPPATTSPQEPAKPVENPKPPAEARKRASRRGPDEGASTDPESGADNQQTNTNTGGEGLP